MDIYGHANGHVVERLFRQKSGGITKQEKGFAGNDKSRGARGFTTAARSEKLEITSTNEDRSRFSGTASRAPL
jgi:hypothetical protein